MPNMITRSKLRSNRRRQAGSVVVYTGVTLLAVLVSAVIAIELGRSYQAHRTYQKMASIAALDAVRLVSRCDVSTPPTLTQLQNAVDDSLDRNGDLLDIVSKDIDVGIVSVDETTSQRYLTETSLNNANAVRVTLEGNFPNTLTGFLPQAGVMRVSATAQQSAIGSFFVGSAVVDVNSRNTILSGLLGDNVTLTAVGYQNLLSANISLAQLGTAVGLTVQDLSDPLALSTQTPILSDVLNGLAEQLSLAGNSAVATLLETLAEAASNGENSPVPLDLILGAIDNTAAEAPLLNVLDIVTALAQAANADSTGLAAPIALSVQAVPGVGTVSTFLRVIEPAQLGVGRPGEAEASTAQVRLLVRIEASSLLNGLKNSITSLVNGLLSVVGALAGVVVSVDVLPASLNLGVDVNVAEATAYLDRIQCPRNGVNNGDPIAELSAASASAGVQIGTFTGSASAAPPLAAASNIPLATVAINATCVGVRIGSACLGLNLGSTTLTTALAPTSLGVGRTGPNPLNPNVTQFTPETGLSNIAPPIYTADGIPPEAPVAGNPSTVGSPLSIVATLGLTSSQSGGGLLGVLGGLINNVVTGVTALVQPLLNIVNGLASSTINPLLNALGIRTGTADVIMQSVTLERPQIVTTCLPDSPLPPPRGCPG